jgi:hypothetical protein
MKKITGCILAVFIAVSACGQTVTPFTLNVAGGSYNNTSSYHRFEWSFGEAIVVDLLAPADSSIMVTHGILQPCTDKTGNSPDISFFGTDEYRLFPNPTADRVELNFFVRQSGRMSLKLVDATSRVLEQRTYQYAGCCRIDQFDLSRYPDGVYYLVADLEPSDRSTTRHGGFKIVKLKN